jgi:galactokinase
VVSAEAPGRVNLLGDHTDYNDGFVLPTAIPQKTRVSVERSGTKQFSVQSDQLSERSEFALEAPPEEQFAKYVYGCVKELRQRGVDVPPLAFRVTSDLPMGVGLSSSAALEVATLRALRALLRLDVDDVLIARIAQQAEVRHAGVNCGILDQMACSLAVPGKALFLDTRTLERRLIPLPAESAILVVDSGVSRSLAKSGYNERRAECEEAARLLGMHSLRDVHEELPLRGLPERLRRRVRHVTSENHRVLRAVEGVPAAAFGQLMSASHLSLRDDYEVSTPEVDALVAALEAQQGVYGARLTGGGFGGACVALCHPAEVERAGAEAVMRCPGARVLVPDQAEAAKKRESASSSEGMSGARALRSALYEGRGAQ